MNDDHPEASARGGGLGARLRDDLVMGLRFYSRLPAGNRLHEPPELNRIALVLPATSFIIGLAPALLLVSLSRLGVPAIFAAGLSVALLLVLTGAMAEDGLADAADGVFGGTTPARRLEIMRDPAHGTYGILALILLLLLRVVGIGAVAAFDPVGAALMWLGAMVSARSGSLWLAVALPPARPDGLSASVGGITRPVFAAGGVAALVLAGALALPVAGLWGVLLATILLAAMAAGWAAACRRLVGGQTGDLIGALQAVLELAALTVFLVFA